jgi:hypothetical protein
MEIEIHNKLCEALEIPLKNNHKKELSIIHFRLKYLGLLETCSRCSGTGNYSYNQINGTICFKCNGLCVLLPKVIKQSLIDQAEKLVKEGKLVPYFEEVKRTREIEKSEKTINDMIWKSKISKDYVIEYDKDRKNINEKIKSLRFKQSDISKPLEELSVKLFNTEIKFKKGKVSKDILDTFRNEYYELYLKVKSELEELNQAYENEFIGN